MKARVGRPKLGVITERKADIITQKKNDAARDENRILRVLLKLKGANPDKILRNAKAE